MFISEWIKENNSIFIENFSVYIIKRAVVYSITKISFSYALQRLFSFVKN